MVLLYHFCLHVLTIVFAMCGSTVMYYWVCLFVPLAHLTVLPVLSCGHVFDQTSVYLFALWAFVSGTLHDSALHFISHQLFVILSTIVYCHEYCLSFLCMMSAYFSESDSLTSLPATSRPMLVSLRDSCASMFTSMIEQLPISYCASPVDTFNTTLPYL